MRLSVVAEVTARYSGAARWVDGDGVGLYDAAAERADRIYRFPGRFLVMVFADRSALLIASGDWMRLPYFSGDTLEALSLGVGAEVVS